MFEEDTEEQWLSEVGQRGIKMMAKFKITGDLRSACAVAKDIHFVRFAHPVLIARFSNGRQKVFPADGDYPSVSGDQSARMIPILRGRVLGAGDILEIGDE